MTSPLGPNTNAPRRLLAQNVLVCAGEDPTEVARAIACLGDPLAMFAYRCYRFWSFERLTVIWTGIGTGCLEPLLFEILRPGVIRRLGLVGTAGTIRPTKLPAGAACWIESAYSLGMSIDSWVGEQPLEPRWQEGLPRPECLTSIVSTDFYYLTSPAGLERFADQIPPLFREQYARRVSDCDLIDMETAAFFFFARLLGKETLEEFVSVKGASNSIEHQEEQVARSQGVLSCCFKAALHRWGIIE